MLTVGRIVKPHGVRGEVLVAVRTDDPMDRFSAGSVLVTDPAEAGPLTVEYARGQTAAAGPGGARLIVGFAEIVDRDGADAARGVSLLVESAELADPEDPDEFLDHRLVGLAAHDTAGEVLGEVIRVEHVPAADLLVLRRPDGREAMVPFVTAMVPEVDVAGGRLVVTPPEGLLDL
ncbi:MAG: ribosome maturation factor RimM [Actinocatenispora sp.]